MIKTGSDFSGVGAFDQALIRLGINYKTIFACDLDKYARQTYIENYGKPQYFPEDVYKRDITKQSLDIYMTSPPCQAFSLAGKRKGEEDKRGILFYNSHQFIKINKPRYFIFENVKGLLSDNKGRTFQRWLDYLGKSINGNPILFPHPESVNYHIYFKVLNSKDFGVPQNRERVFIVGIRDDKDNQFRFPKEERLTKRLKDVIESDVDEKYFLSNEAIKKGYESGNISTGNKRLDRSIKTYVLKESPTIIDSYNNTIHTEHSPTISTRVNASSCTHLFNNYQIRRLTPRECFRLMDFPDSFSWKCSDSQAYKQAGNSITVGVLAKIIEKLNL